MRKARAIGILLVVLATALLVAILAGALPGMVGIALPCFLIGAFICWVLAGAFGSQELNERRARELDQRGVRRRGRVRDALPYQSTHGAPVLFQAEGVLMVLRVELVADANHPAESVSVHIVEDSEQARARIGHDLTVLVHPEDPTLRAVQGHLPNGQRALG